MMSTQNFLDHLQLTDEQRALCDRLVSRILRFEEQMADAPDALSLEEEHGVFAIFGSRGAGKTALAHRVLKKLKSTERSQLLCVQPIDCSTFNRHLPLGLNILQHLHRQLSVEKTETKHEAETEAAKCWQELESRYLSLDSGYRNLKLSLAITSSEYEDMARSEANARQSIQVALRKWVGEVLKRKSDKPDKSLILVPLDDLDLPFPGMLQDFFGTFLYELREERLLFLTVADEERLEKLIADDRATTGEAKKNISEATVARLLSKLIPEHHRIYVEPWSENDCLALELDRDGKAEETLEHHLEQACQVAMSSSAEDPNPHNLSLDTLKILLPRFPRGLVDLYKNLRAFHEAPAANQEEAELEQPTMKDLVLVLARCRGDHRLARVLATRVLDWWGGHWEWDQERNDSVAWNQTVSEAQADAVAIGALTSSRLPLRLTAEEDRALWTEFLLNVFLQQADLRALDFIQRFQPLLEQSRLCSFEHEILDNSGVQVLVQKESLALTSPLFYWEGSREKKVTAKVGWGALIQNILHSGRPTIERILEEFGADITLQPQKASPAAILPAEIRPLILLVDAMNTFPWEQFGEALQKDADDESQWIRETLDVCCWVYLTLCRQHHSSKGKLLRTKVSRFGEGLLQASSTKARLEMLERQLEQAKGRYEDLFSEQDAQALPLLRATENFLKLAQKLQPSASTS